MYACIIFICIIYIYICVCMYVYMYMQYICAKYILYIKNIIYNIYIYM